MDEAAWSRALDAHLKVFRDVDADYIEATSACPFARYLRPERSEIFSTTVHGVEVLLVESLDDGTCHRAVRRQSYA